MATTITAERREEIRQRNEKIKAAIKTAVITKTVEMAKAIGVADETAFTFANDLYTACETVRMNTHRAIWAEEREKRAAESTESTADTQA